MIVASVNNYDIDEREFLAELNRLLREKNRQQVNAQMKEIALDNLISGAIILEEARLQNLSVSEDEVQQEMINFQMCFKTSEEYEEFLKSTGLTHEQMLQRLYDKILVRRYLESCVSKEFDVDDQYLREFYEKNILLFNTELMIRVSHILTTLDKGLAGSEELRQEIKNPKDFDQVAKKCSECPSCCQAGDLGYIVKGKMVKEFDETAFNLKVNEISQPVKTKHGYHIIMVTERKEPGTLSFDEVKEPLKKRLCQIEYELEVDRHIKDLRDKADIYINEEYFGFKLKKGAL
ncbi:MAG: peptidylprolyl isomerase [Candidatus Cloacimonetes bacterium]|nr:peptidylprolyl isomerase [Candidatus Cloacimonadota bacterium]